MKYVVSEGRHVTYNGKPYPVGKTIELDDETAQPLLDCGAVEKPADKKDKAAPAT